MVILAILIAAGCTPSLRPHDRARGTRGIAVESAGKTVISITAHNAARPAGSPREDLFSAAKSAAWQVLAERRGAPPVSAPGALSYSDNGRLSTPWREVIFLSTVMDSLFDQRSPALVYGPKSMFR